MVLNNHQLERFCFIPCACRCRWACDSYTRKQKCYWFIYRQKHGKFSFLNMTYWADWTHIPSIIPWFNVQLGYCCWQSSRHLFVWQLSVFNVIEFRCTNLHVVCVVEIQQVHLHLKLPVFEWTRLIYNSAMKIAYRGKRRFMVYTEKIRINYHFYI